MTKMKHTPGPWVACIMGTMKHDGEEFRPNHEIHTEYVRPPGSVNNVKVAEAYQPYSDEPALNPVTVEESKANAFLIAAVPDLLEVALLALTIPNAKLVAMAATAITKAQGETQ